jgi:hypothetical protein
MCEENVVCLYQKRVYGVSIWEDDTDYIFEMD